MESLVSVRKQWNKTIYLKMKEAQIIITTLTLVTCSKWGLQIAKDYFNHYILYA